MGKTSNERIIEALAGDGNQLSVSTCQTNFTLPFGVVTSGNANQVTINLVSLLAGFQMTGDTQGQITPNVTQVILNAKVGPWPLNCTFTGNFPDGDVTAVISFEFGGEPWPYSGPVGIVPSP